MRATRWIGRFLLANAAHRVAVALPDKTALARSMAATSFRSMALTSVYLAEEVLSLPAEQRRMLAKLLMDSVADDGRSEDEIRSMLRTRLDDLKSGRDVGMRSNRYLARGHDCCLQLGLQAGPARSRDALYSDITEARR